MCQTTRNTILIATLLGTATLGCSSRLAGEGVSPEDLGDELVGAGGRDLTEFWPDIDVPYSENTKMLTFDMLRNEVKRATGLSWQLDEVDLWEANRSVLGGADYQDTFTDSRTPSQQRIVAIRKMAFGVCGDLLAKEAGSSSRTVFDVVDPASTISTTQASIGQQVDSLFERFFYEPPSDNDRQSSLTLLDELQKLENPQEAWRGLCAAYLASMRFLSY